MHRAIIVLVRIYSLLNNQRVLDWNDLRYFLAVAETGTTSGAARALGSSQPTVVRRIGVIEDDLKLTLFDRHANGYRLTPHGEALLPSARRAAEQMEEFEAQARARVRSGNAIIRLTVPEASVAALTPLIVKFRERFPDVRVEMQSADAWADLLKGEADVAVRAGQFEQIDGLVGTLLSDVGWALYASPDYIDVRGLPAGPDDLSAHAIIGAEGKLAEAPAFAWLERHAGNVPVVWRSNVLSAVVSAIRAGLGIAPLPCAVASREPGIEPVTGAIPELAGSMWVVTRNELRLDPPVKHLMELIVDHLRMQADLISGRTIKLRDR